MARRWTQQEEATYKAELERLYVRENKTIGEIAVLLGLAESSVYDRLLRLQIPSMPYAKKNYLNKRKDIRLPSRHSPTLAEYFGIMLGDGHVSPTQAIVTLGSKELEYVQYVARLISRLFGTPATTIARKSNYRDVYIGSVELTSWLLGEGLVRNKVAAQVDVPSWIHSQEQYMQSFLRGFFDTDGSVYRIRYGIQISLTNRSVPLLLSLQRMLIKLGYTASNVSADKLYLTRRNDVERFFSEIRPANQKHVRRYEQFSQNLTRR